MKEEITTKSERRECRKRKRIPQHGKSIGRIYHDSVLKRYKDIMEKDKSGRIEQR